MAFAVVVLALLVGGFSVVGLATAFALDACGVHVPWWAAAILLAVVVGVLQAGSSNNPRHPDL